MNAPFIRMVITCLTAFLFFSCSSNEDAQESTSNLDLEKNNASAAPKIAIKKRLWEFQRLCLNLEGYRQLHYDVRSQLRDEAWAMFSTAGEVHKYVYDKLNQRALDYPGIKERKVTTEFLQFLKRAILNGTNNVNYKFPDIPGKQQYLDQLANQIDLKIDNPVKQRVFKFTSDLAKEQLLNNIYRSLGNIEFGSDQQEALIKDAGFSKNIPLNLLRKYIGDISLFDLKDKYNFPVDQKLIEDEKNNRKIDESQLKYEIGHLLRFLGQNKADEMNFDRSFKMKLLSAQDIAEFEPVLTDHFNGSFDCMEISLIAAGKVELNRVFPATVESRAGDTNQFTVRGVGYVRRLRHVDTSSETGKPITIQVPTAPELIENSVTKLITAQSGRVRVKSLEAISKLKKQPSGCPNERRSYQLNYRESYYYRNMNAASQHTIEFPSSFQHLLVSEIGSENLVIEPADPNPNEPGQKNFLEKNFTFTEIPLISKSSNQFNSFFRKPDFNWKYREDFRFVPEGYGEMIKTADFGEICVEGSQDYLEIVRIGAQKEYHYLSGMKEGRFIRDASLPLYLAFPVPSCDNLYSEQLAEVHKKLVAEKCFEDDV